MNIILLRILICSLLAGIAVAVPFMLKYKNHFFGWDNFKWLVRELVKMYSKEESFFSYKRFQMGVAFFIFTQGAMYTLTKLVSSVSEFLLWATPVLFIAGYTLNKVQEEKKDDAKKDPE